LLGFGATLPSRPTRHPQIQQHGVGVVLLQPGQRRAPVSDRRRVMAEIDQGLGNRIADCSLVIDDQDS
jgi:hypothetical protein